MNHMTLDQMTIWLLAFAWLAARWAHLVSLKMPLWLHADWLHQSTSFLAQQDTVMDPDALDVSPRDTAMPAPTYSWWTPGRAPSQRQQAHRFSWLPFIGPSLNKDWRGLWSEIWVVTLSAILIFVVFFVMQTGQVPDLGIAYVVGGILFLAWLQCMTNIDYKTQFLPDVLTISLLWLGLLWAVLDKGLVPPAQAIQGAIIGYGMLWGLGKAFLILRKKDGMGGGDMKLVAAVGAWTGVQGVMLTLGLASFIGLGYALLLALRRKNFSKFAFGPSIATAAVFVYILMPLMHLAVRQVSSP